MDKQTDREIDFEWKWGVYAARFEWVIKQREDAPGVVASNAKRKW